MWSSWKYQRNFLTLSILLLCMVLTKKESEHNKKESEHKTYGASENAKFTYRAYVWAFYISLEINTLSSGWDVTNGSVSYKQWGNGIRKAGCLELLWNYYLGKLTKFSLIHKSSSKHQNWLHREDCSKKLSAQPPATLVLAFVVTANTKHRSWDALKVQQETV